MKKTTGWGIVLVLFLLLVGAACGGDPPPPPPPPSPPTPATLTPTTVAVTITSEGNFEPIDIAPNPSDTVAFLANTDVVLCVDTSAVFGDIRYPIPNGTTKNLVVLAEAERLDFAYIAVLGDSTSTCDGTKGGEGGGTTGPP